MAENSKALSLSFVGPGISNLLIGEPITLRAKGVLNKLIRPLKII